jgi:WG repeat protein
MDRSGTVVVHAGVWSALEFSEGLAPAPVSQLDRPPRWGFIDRTGQFAIPPQYFGVWQFSEGLARVFVSGEVGSTG